MKLPVYLGLLHRAEATLAQSFRQVGDGHRDEPDVYLLCRALADQCDAHNDVLQPVVQRYGQAPSGDEPERLHADGLSQTRSGGSVCSATYRICICWRPSSTSAGRWSNKPARAFGTASCWMWWTGATPRPLCRCSGSGPG